ncbi:hypothetical protein M1D49_17310 [Bacillus sp. PK3-056]|nr:hypothetical protein [Niallia circulans]QJX61645.1 hypothetical protein HLK66_08285 [Niallia circulans]
MSCLVLQVFKKREQKPFLAIGIVTKRSTTLLLDIPNIGFYNLTIC